MSKSPYSDEFKSEAIKQIMANGMGVLEVSRATGVSDFTLLYKWLKAAGWKSGESKEQRKLSETEKELRALKSELKKVKMERDILKRPQRTLPGSPSKVRVHQKSQNNLPCSEYVQRPESSSFRLLSVAKESAFEENHQKSEDY